MEKVRVGIIGVGNMGSAHANRIFKGDIDRMVLGAVCDNDPAKIEKAKAAEIMEI